MWKKTLLIFSLIFCAGVTTLIAAPKMALSLYVHIDKNIYMPGETIWFKGYFLEPTKKLHETIIVKIIDLRQNKLIIEQEFPVYDIRSHGQIILPDDIPVGNYSFIAYGNKAERLDNNTVFVQKIKILKNSGNAVSVKSELVSNTILSPGKPVAILFNVTKGGRIVKDVKGKLTIEIVEDKKPLLEKKIETDENGVATATFSYPDILGDKHIVANAEFNVDKEVVTSELFLPSQLKQIKAEVAIEGGVLISGAKNNILIKIKDESDSSLSNCKIILRENEIDIKSEVTDSLGVANIQFVPLEGHKYNILIAGVDNQVSRIINLPDGQAGIMLKLEDNKTLKIINSGRAAKRRLELTSKNEILFSKELFINEKDSVPIMLPKRDINTLISAQLLDENGYLTNERTFIQGKTTPYKISITSLNKNNKPRDKVKLKIHIETNDGEPIIANISTAVIWNKVINKADYKTIFSTAYNFTVSEKEIKSILAQPLSLINNLLIGQQWKHDSNLTESIIQNNAGIAGKLISKKKKQPITIKSFLVGTENGPKTVKIEKDGRFLIPAEYLLAGEDFYNYIIPNDIINDNYTIRMDSIKDYSPVLKNLALKDNRITYAVKSHDPMEILIPGAIELENVVIEKKTFKVSDADYERWSKSYPANCRDYVCGAGVLNCRTHKEGTRPVLGEKYIYRDRKYQYTHCIECDCIDIIYLKSISLPRPFNIIKYADAFETKYYTTIYWDPNIYTNKDGDAILEFTASDVVGNYQIIAQGIDINNNGILYSDKTLNVSPSD